MVSPTVTIATGLIQWISAGLYLWVARMVVTRHVEGETKRANTLFGVWWAALGLVFLFAPFLSVLPRVIGYQDLALSITLLNAVLLLVAVAVWGLVYYLVYLYTGNSRFFWPLTAFYVAFALALLYVVAYLDPNGFDASGTLTFTRGQLNGAPAIALGLLFSGPVIAAALAYGSLYFRVREREQKYRVGLVSGAFLVQFGWSFVSSLLQLPRRYPDSVAVSLAGNVLGILSAIAILIAFRPPRMIRERLSIPEAGGV
ncbi:MAG: hypothetical protein ACYDCK_09895 [Thermoplasmatota archaeon]